MSVTGNKEFEDHPRNELPTSSKTVVSPRTTSALMNRTNGGPRIFTISDFDNNKKKAGKIDGITRFF
jgi:hypothetical protein